MRLIDTGQASSPSYVAINRIVGNFMLHDTADYLSVHELITSIAFCNFILPFAATLIIPVLALTAITGTACVLKIKQACQSNRTAMAKQTSLIVPEATGYDTLTEHHPMPMAPVLPK